MEGGQTKDEGEEEYFYKDKDGLKSQKVLQRTGSLKGKVEAYEGLVAKYEDTHALIELANEEEDQVVQGVLLELMEDIVEGIKQIIKEQLLWKRKLHLIIQRLPDILVKVR